MATFYFLYYKCTAVFLVLSIQKWIILSDDIIIEFSPYIESSDKGSQSFFGHNKYYKYLTTDFIVPGRCSNCNLVKLITKYNMKVTHEAKCCLSFPFAYSQQNLKDYSFEDKEWKWTGSIRSLLVSIQTISQWRHKKIPYFIL